MKLNSRQSATPSVPRPTISVRGESAEKNNFLKMEKEETGADGPPIDAACRHNENTTNGVEVG